MYDSRFVECRDRARRSIRHQQQTLVVHRAQGVLHDRGDGAVPRVAPRCKPLEAVEDLVAIVTGGYDAQRRLGQVCNRRSNAPRAECREAGADLFDRELTDIAPGQFLERARAPHGRDAAPAR